MNARRSRASSTRARYRAFLIRAGRDSRSPRSSTPSVTRRSTPHSGWRSTRSSCARSCTPPSSGRVGWRRLACCRRRPAGNEWDSRSLPCPSWVTDSSTALDVTAVLVAVATLLSAAELLALRAEFSSHGLFDARVLTSTRPGFLAGRFTSVSTPRIAGAQLVLAVMVIVFLTLDVSPALPLVGLAVATILQRVLIPYGRDGSDELGRVLTITAAIAFVFARETYVARLALGFIAAQLCLAYV